MNIHKWLTNDLFKQVKESLKMNKAKKEGVNNSFIDYLVMKNSSKFNEIVVFGCKAVDMSKDELIACLVELNKHKYL